MSTVGSESIVNAPPQKTMKIIYRISDGEHNKLKPYYVTKKNCFLHFMKVFEGYTIYVIADNVKDYTYSFLCKYLQQENIIIGHHFYGLVYWQYISYKQQ